MAINQKFIRELVHIDQSDDCLALGHSRFFFAALLKFYCFCSANYLKTETMPYGRLFNFFPFILVSMEMSCQFHPYGFLEHYQRLSFTVSSEHELQFF